MNVRRDPPVSDSVRAEVGARIRARREALGLSQNQLGRRLTNTAGNSVLGSQVSKWERGMLPERFFWPQLAAALESPESGLLGALAEEGDGPMLAMVEEIRDRVEILAELLGMTDAVETSLRARRAATARRGDRAELPPQSLLPEQDLDGGEDSVGPPASLRPLRSGNARKPHKG